MMKDSSSSNAVSDHIWDQLRLTAMEDGIITPEENRLISNIVVDVKKYGELVDLAIEDNIITEDEKIELFEGRMLILEKAYAIARDDTKISNDEAEILKTIVNLIVQLEKKI